MELILGFLKLPSHNLTGRTKENHQELQFLGPPKYNDGMW